MIEQFYLAKLVSAGCSLQLETEKRSGRGSSEVIGVRIFLA